MAIETKIKSHPNVVKYFKEIPFYNKRIKNPKTKDLLSELLFYEELNLILSSELLFYEKLKSILSELIAV